MDHKVGNAHQKDKFYPPVDNDQQAIDKRLELSFQHRRLDYYCNMSAAGYRGRP